MIIENKLTGNKGMFFIGDENKVLAEMIYSLPNKNEMIIEHTEVSDELRGQNIGYKLVHEGVEYARKNHLKIIPVCPFAKSVLERKPEFADVLQ